MKNPRSGGASVVEVNDTEWLWCSASGNTVRINVSENTTGKSRNSVVEIGYSGMTGKIQVPVTQTTSKTTLTVTPASISCDYKSKTQTFTIKVTDPLNNVDVEATPNAYWIKVNSVSNTSASVTISKNLSTASRSSGITFKYGDLITVVPVTQGGNTVSDGFVDLGLSSGTLWASCNLGAEYEYEAGTFYAWAETATKSKFNWSNYKWGKKNSLTKYNATDKKTAVEPADDPAYQKNHDWSMPTAAQFNELASECEWEWVLSPVPGVKVKSKVGDTYIFFPAVGYKEDGWQDDWTGYYWSKSLNTRDRNQAVSFIFGETFSITGNYERCLGMPIRPVKSGK